MIGGGKGKGADQGLSSRRSGGSGGAFGLEAPQGRDADPGRGTGLRRSRFRIELIDLRGGVANVGGCRVIPPMHVVHPPPRGALAATSCYLMWGLMYALLDPTLRDRPVELIAHRHVGFLVVVAALVVLQGTVSEVGEALRSGRILGVHLLSGTLLTVNWLVYVWGVNTGHVIKTSLGYFLVPLANVTAGRFLLHEHLRRLQWVAIGCAAVGVAVMVAQVHRVPWIALILAATFIPTGYFANDLRWAH